MATSYYHDMNISSNMNYSRHTPLSKKLKNRYRKLYKQFGIVPTIIGKHNAVNNMGLKTTGYDTTRLVSF
eukprot:1840222-Ditylum_brightwellii.AAC.1